MSDTALILPDNLSHNVSAHIETAKNSLGGLSAVYLVTEVRVPYTFVQKNTLRSLHLQCHLVSVENVVVISLGLGVLAVLGRLRRSAAANTTS